MSQRCWQRGRVDLTLVSRSLYSSNASCNIVPCGCSGGACAPDRYDMTVDRRFFPAPLTVSIASRHVSIAWSAARKACPRASSSRSSEVRPDSPDLKASVCTVNDFSASWRSSSVLESARCRLTATCVSLIICPVSSSRLSIMLSSERIGAVMNRESSSTRTLTSLSCFWLYA